MIKLDLGNIESEDGAGLPESSLKNTKDKKRVSIILVCATLVVIKLNDRIVRNTIKLFLLIIAPQKSNY